MRRGAVGQHHVTLLLLDTVGSEKLSAQLTSGILLLARSLSGNGVTNAGGWVWLPQAPRTQGTEMPQHLNQHQQQ